ncbi:hypothetical protein, partial [Oscillibacter sp.]|uniref:hypothetical protein n=1 Tax=Oscillibacter sp. TaxID=1945593 RepID=UPI00289F2DE5
MKKKMMSLALAVVMCMTLSVPAFATGSEDSSYNSVALSKAAIATVTEDDLLVSEDEANYIAQLFVSDLVKSEAVSWNENTDVVRIVPMYDQENNTTAYTVELTEGYVVVSAYMGVDNIILEWSDVAEPIYHEFEFEDNERIIYAGQLGYYKDSGLSTLENLDGEQIMRTEIENSLASAKEVENVPTPVLAAIIEEKSAVSRGVFDDEIDDPFAHANQYYVGPFSRHDSINKWESNGRTIECHSTSEFSGYKNHCGPTAITNMLIMYGNRYGINTINRKSTQDIFQRVADIGTANLYYVNSDLGGVIGGTSNTLAAKYTQVCFEEYGIDSGFWRRDLTYDNIVATLEEDYIMYVMLQGHQTYGNHHIVGYAYTHLISSTTGLFKTYLKVADGWTTHPRYIDLASASGDDY